MIESVIREHGAEASMLYVARARLATASHPTLFDLRRMDERIAAHLDGLAVAAEAGWKACDALLEEPSAGEVFVVAYRTLHERQSAGLGRLLALAENSAELTAGLLAGFGWVAQDRLRGVVAELLRSEESFPRRIGVGACAFHRVDPGVNTRLADADPAVRARLLRSAGELGKRELVSLCARTSADEEDASCQFWAAWSAVLLGDRESALASLQARAFAAADAHQPRAFQLALQATNVEQGHELLQVRASDPMQARTVIQGAGYVGDPKYVPWLIRQMDNDRLARLAGESFSTITGLNLAQPPFERPRPENFESGPSEIPEDEEVAMDADDDLPWPAQAALQEWWSRHGARFATGVRHFMGAVPERGHCIEVLKTGYQRQRIAAAYHLCLLNPGTPLFEWRAPAWRQQRELAQIA